MIKLTVPGKAQAAMDAGIAALDVGQDLVRFEIDASSAVRAAPSAWQGRAADACAWQLRDADAKLQSVKDTVWAYSRALTAFGEGLAAIEHKLHDLRSTARYGGLTITSNAILPPELHLPEGGPLDPAVAAAQGQYDQKVHLYKRLAEKADVQYAKASKLYQDLDAAMKPIIAAPGLIALARKASFWTDPEAGNAVEQWTALAAAQSATGISFLSDWAARTKLGDLVGDAAKRESLLQQGRLDLEGRLRLAWDATRSQSYGAVANGADLTRAAERATKWGRAGALISGVVAGVEEYQSSEGDPTKSEDRRRGEAITKGAFDAGGALAGAAFGAKVGGFVGSVIPGAGTVAGAVVGGAIGGLVGGVAGSSLGDAAGDALKGAVGDAVDGNWDRVGRDLSAAPGKFADNVKETWNSFFH